MTNNSDYENRFININQVRYFVWSFVLPPICLVGVATNLLNVIVFTKSLKTKNLIYRCFLVHSLLDLAYMIISFVFFMLKACYARRYNHHYWIQVYEYFFYLFLSTTLATYMVCIELIISVKRLLLVLNSRLSFKPSFKTNILLSGIFCLVIHLPLPVAISIKQSKTTLQLDPNWTWEATKYEISYENATASPLYKTLIGMALALRGSIAPVFIIIINIILAKKMGRQLNRKRELQSVPVNGIEMENQCLSPKETAVTKPPFFSSNRAIQLNLTRIQSAKRNLTRMIISMNSLFILSNVSTYVSTLCVVTLGNKSAVAFLSTMISNIILFTIHSSAIFVYFNCDRIFKATFRATIFRLND